MWYDEPEHYAAELFHGKRTKRSGAGRHEKLDVECKNILIEVKGSPRNNPRKYIFKPYLFQRYMRHAQRKALRFMYFVLLQQYCVAIMLKSDLESLGVSFVEPFEEYLTIPKNKSGSYSISQSVLEDLGSNEEWQIVFGSAEDPFVLFKAESLASLLSLVGAL